MASHLLSFIFDVYAFCKSARYDALDVVIGGKGGHAVACSVERNRTFFDERFELILGYPDGRYCVPLIATAIIRKMMNMQVADRAKVESCCSNCCTNGRVRRIFAERSRKKPFVARY